MAAMSLDLATLMIVSATGIGFAGFMLALPRLRDPNANCVGLWGLAMILSAAGFVIIVGKPLPRPWPVITGNAVIVLGAGLTWAGARVFAARRVSRAGLAAGPAILVALGAAQGIADTLHLLITVLLIGLYSGLAAMEIARRGPENLPSRQSTLFLLLAHTGFQLARAVLMMAVPAVLDRHNHAVYVCVFLEGLLYAIGMSSALLAMMKERAEYRSTLALREMTMIDELTGLGNRRQFDEAIATRTAARGEALALLMIDVDHFKLYNDTYGHLPGDDCLRAIAGAILRHVRKPDATATRYGGEEFAVLLAATDEAGAMEVAARIHASVAALSVEHATSPYGILTVSIGVAAASANTTTQQLVRQADWALYVAKQEGRNATRAASETRDSGVLRATG
jgi:diguanylate cyclase (GGDEF)-like protein